MPTALGLLRFRRLVLPTLLLGAACLPGCRPRTPEAPADRPSERPTRRPRSSGSGSEQSTGASRGDDGNLLLGNLSNAGRDPNNLLLEKPQYALSYNARQGGPNWVSWHLQESDLGEADRSAFRPDTALPVALQIRSSDYKGSGYDRGHVCPSGDRTARKRDNEATFAMSNMLPQAPALNQHVWKDLEDHCRDLAREGAELYISAGGAGSLGRIADGKVNVPAACWKVIVVLPRGNNDLSRIGPRTRVIAVAMPNKDTQEVERSTWSQYLISPARIERSVGVRFFSTLPASTRQALIESVDSGSDDPNNRRAPGRAPQTRS